MLSHGGLPFFCEVLALAVSRFKRWFNSGERLRLDMLQTSGWLVSHREESLHVDVLSIEYKTPERQVATLSWSGPTFLQSAGTQGGFESPCTSFRVVRP